MGYGSYSSSAHTARTRVRSKRPVEQVFKQREIHSEMDPMGLKHRESRDSDEHPNSVGVQFWLDQTGSMHDIPANLAKHTLPKFVGNVIKILPDAQVLLGAFGDSRTSEASPWQVGQFESSDELMDKWLTAMHLVRMGGGNNAESYELAFYTAARHTSMDCWEKRGKKGYFFMTGDEPHFSHVRRSDVLRLSGTDIGEDIPIKAIVEEVKRTFHPFFLIPDPQRGAYVHHRFKKSIEAIWRELLGDHVITLACPEDSAVVSAILVGLTEGRFNSLHDVAATLREDFDRSGGEVNRVINAVTAYASSIGCAGQSRPVSSNETSQHSRSGNTRL